jgi:hypothetical protein
VLCISRDVIQRHKCNGIDEVIYMYTAMTIT